MSPKKRDKDADEIERLIFDLADRFLASSEMPEVGIHFARLQKEGHATESAKRMIGTVLLTNLYLGRKSGTSVDVVQLKVELARLPKLGVAPDGRMLDIRGAHSGI